VRFAAASTVGIGHTAHLIVARQSSPGHKRAVSVLTGIPARAALGRGDIYLQREPPARSPGEHVNGRSCAGRQFGRQVDARQQLLVPLVEPGQPVNVVDYEVAHHPGIVNPGRVGGGPPGDRADRSTPTAGRNVALSITANVITCSRVRAMVAVSATTAALAVGCTVIGPDGPEKIVFATSRTTIQVSGASPTKTTLDFSNLLNNVTGTRVRVLSIRLVFPSARVIHAMTIKAYSFRRSGAGVFEGAQGDLEKICPQQFVPIPVNDVIVAPHSYSRWNIVLSFVVPHPVHIPYIQMKVRYEADSHQGWQPLYLNVRFAAIPASKDPALVQPYHCVPTRRS